MSELLTVKQAADYIGVTDKALYFAIEAGRIQPVVLLGKFGINLTEAKRYKKSKRYKVDRRRNGKQKAA